VTARRLLLGVGAAVLVLLVAGQLLLPALAERRLEDRLDSVGTVESIDVDAFPAWKLLAHRADRVEVRMSESEAGQGKVADLLAETGDTDDLDARVERLRVVGLDLTDVRLRKRGPALEGSATVTDAAVRAALPPGFNVRAVGTGNGRLVVEGSADLLGQRFEGSVVAAAVDGRILLSPDVPFGGLLTLTIFDDPRVSVEELGAEERADGVALVARATLP